jgi:DNA end-binding protein Ku
MEQQPAEAFAKVVLNNREQIVMVRPLGRLLAMTVLNYHWQIKPAHEFEAEVADVKLEPKELKLAKTLTEAMAVDDFDISAYPDLYQERLTKLVESNVAGEEIVQPPAAEEEPMVINLMEALQKSVDQAKKAAAGKKPPRQAAPGAAERARDAKQRKRGGA